MVDDNPLAFPVATFGPAGDMIAEPGMFLRDWFAGQALAGIAAYSQYWPDSTEMETLAERAFQAADAMLAARKLGQPS